MVMTSKAVSLTDSLKGKKLPGIVVDNNDPKKLQRCRIRCRGVHSGMPDSALPWAMKATSSGGLPTRVDVPPVGTEVIVEFQDNTLYNPMYYGSRQTEANVNPELTGTNYPHQVSEIDRSGNMMVKDTHTDGWFFTHVSGTSVSFDGHGHLKLSVASGSVGPSATSTNPVGVTLEVQGPINFTATGDINLKSMGKLCLEGMGGIAIRGTINLNDAGPSVSAPTAPTPRTRPTETPFLNQEDYGEH